jgi:hypothetical protein
MTSGTIVVWMNRKSFIGGATAVEVKAGLAHGEGLPVGGSGWACGWDEGLYGTKVFVGLQAGERESTESWSRLRGQVSSKGGASATVDRWRRSAWQPGCITQRVAGGGCATVLASSVDEDHEPFTEEAPRRRSAALAKDCRRRATRPGSRGKRRSFRLCRHVEFAV